MSLRTQLTAVLVALFLGVGTILAFGIVRGSRLYYEEVHYKLNREVAGHVAKSLRPFVSAGEDGAAREELDHDVLMELFMDVMHINPSLEVYLLDAEGHVLAFDAPEGSVVRSSVALAPIRATLASAGAGSIPRGDDPRSLERTKPFSAAELRDEAGRLEGYLYVILGGEAHQAIAASLGESALLRGSAVLLAGSLGLAALVGSLSIVFLVRPLRRLRDAMITFQEAEPQARARASDEVGDLAATFERMADRIACQIEELKRNDRRRREFVANVSHDLRTPTGVIQGYLETLTLRWDRLEGSERQQFLRTALRQAERLGSLVDQLFELSRLEAPELLLQREPFSLGELAQDVVAKFQPAAEKKGVELRASIGYDLPPIVGDIGLIERALDNLIDNAIRYTQPGGSVRVGLEQVSGGLGVSVGDTGPGIPAEDLPRVFERFYRVERHGREGPRGTGLGLAIAKRIVDLHRGEIEVSSDPGQGTVFAFVLTPQAGSGDERAVPKSDPAVILA